MNSRFKITTLIVALLAISSWLMAAPAPVRKVAPQLNSIMGSKKSASIQHPAVKAGHSVNITGSPKAISRQPVRFDVSPPMRSIPVKHFDLSKGPFPLKEMPEPDVEYIPNWNLKQAPDKDGAIRKFDGSKVITMPPPLLQFEGQSLNDDFLTLGFGVLPPDTNGDVGPNHYVQTVNLTFAVYDKSGNIVLYPRPISTLWAGFGGKCETNNDGDPLVLYDEMADRWFITQFAVLNSAGTAFTLPFDECIAISTTGDPAGSYYRYEYTVSGLPGQTSAAVLNDYPHFGIWPDAYYMTDRQFDLILGPFDGCGSFAFDRVKMLAGDPTASFIYFDTGAITNFDDGLLPADMDGPPPPVGAPGLFAIFNATEYGDASDALQIFEFHADFTIPANSTFTARAENPIAVAAFDPTLNECTGGAPIPCNAGTGVCSVAQTSRDDIPQPAPAGNCHFLDAHGNVRLLHRVQYRNFGTFDTLVMSHTTDLLSSAITSTQTHQGGIRYYKLTRDGIPATPFIVDQQLSYSGIGPPSSFNGTHRWEPSAASDHLGNTAVGYSLSSLIRFPTLRYFGVTPSTVHGLNDGTLFHENQIIAGSDSQTNTASRWGDYAELSVDPSNGCTFWFTTEYFTGPDPCAGGSTACWQTRVGTFEFPGCTPAAMGTLEGFVTDASTSTGIAGAMVSAVDGGGNTFSAITDSTGFYSRLLAPGAYTVTASATGYVTSAPVPVVISDGATTTQNFALIPLTSADVSITKTDSPDPVAINTTLTYTLTVTNNGPSDANNVTVTDTLPGSVTFVSATPSQGGPCVGTAPVTCNLGTILNGGSATVTIQVTPTATGTITNTASVDADEGDPDASNNTDSEDTTVTGPCTAAVFCDDFSDGDFTTPLWTVKKGSWSVVTTAATGTTDKKGDLISPDFSCTNCTFEAHMKIETADARISLFGWFVDGKHYVELRLQHDKQSIYIKQKFGDANSHSSVDIPLNVGQTYKVSMTFNGTNFQVKVDDVPIGELTIQKVGTPSGKAYFRVKSTNGSNATGSMDDITVF